MRFLISAVFIGVILLKTGFTFTWEMVYLSQKAELTREFCVNRDKPKLQCNGQCYLAKQLALAEPTAPSEPSLPLPKIDLKTPLIESECIELFSENLHLMAIHSRSLFPVYESIILNGHISPIFHPPLSELSYV